jgi:hypothetical protein
MAMQMERAIAWMAALRTALVWLQVTLVAQPQAKCLTVLEKALMTEGESAQELAQPQV